MSVHVDEPISRRSEDRLSRVPLASAIVAGLLAAAAESGTVTAVIGPWGSGKTSILNFVIEELETRNDVAVVKFNPWYFSGTEQLIQRFLSELAAQLASRKDRALKGLADKLEAYASVLEPLGAIPVAGELAKATTAAAKVAAGTASKAQPFGRGSIADQRRAINEAIGKWNRRVVIVIDDIDRLEAEEIRDVVRLVRLVADFPRTHYLLAFDRKSVERALSALTTQPWVASTWRRSSR